MFRGANRVMWAKRGEVEALPIENPTSFRGIELSNYIPEYITHSTPGVNSIALITPTLTAKIETESVSELRENYSSKVA